MTSARAAAGPGRADDASCGAARAVSRSRAVRRRSFGRRPNSLRAQYDRGGAGFLPGRLGPRHIHYRLSDIREDQRSHGQYVRQSCPQRSPGAVAGGGCGRRRRCGAVRHLDPAAVRSRVARRKLGHAQRRPPAGSGSEYRCRSCRGPLVVRLSCAHRSDDDPGGVLLCSIDHACGTYSSDDDAIRVGRCSARTGPASRPSKSPRPETGPVRSPSLGGERWGKGIEWPDAWRRPSGAPRASPRGRGSDNENADDSGSPGMRRSTPQEGLMRRLRLLLVDCALTALAGIIALLLRDNFEPSLSRLAALTPYLVLTVAGTAIVFPALGISRTIWRFTVMKDYLRLLAGIVLAIVARSGLRLRVQSAGRGRARRAGPAGAADDHLPDRRPRADAAAACGTRQACPAGGDATALRSRRDRAGCWPVSADGAVSAVGCRVRARARAYCRPAGAQSGAYGAGGEPVRGIGDARSGRCDDTRSRSTWRSRHAHRRHDGLRPVARS